MDLIKETKKIDLHAHPHVAGGPERMHDPITSRDAKAMHESYPETFPWWFCALDPA